MNKGHKASCDVKIMELKPVPVIKEILLTTQLLHRMTWVVFAKNCGLMPLISDSVTHWYPRVTAHLGLYPL